MENKLTPELIEKAKLAKSAEEIFSLAKENGVELTAESANAYFAQLHKTGELGDDELDSVSGGDKCGTTYKDGRPVVSGLNYCDHWSCEECCNEGKDGSNCKKNNSGSFCMNCVSSRYEDGLLLCYHPDRYHN